MNRKFESSIHFASELDPQVAASLEQMLASEPSEEGVARALESARSLKTTSDHSRRPTVVAHQFESRLLPALSASLLLVVLWFGSASDAWGQIALDFQNSGKPIEVVSDMDVPDSMIDPDGTVPVRRPVGAIRRFILILHVFSLIIGLIGMLVSWLLSLFRWVAPTRDAVTGGFTLRWEARTLKFGCAIYAIGILAGCVWAQATWGAAWRWDPRESLALITLGIGVMWCAILSQVKAPTAESTNASSLYLTLPSIAFWMVMLAYVLASIYAARIHSSSYPGMLPTIVCLFFVCQLALCGVWGWLARRGCRPHRGLADS